MASEVFTAICACHRTMLALPRLPSCWTTTPTRPRGFLVRLLLATCTLCSLACTRRLLFHVQIAAQETTWQHGRGQPFCAGTTRFSRQPIFTASARSALLLAWRAPSTSPGLWIDVIEPCSSTCRSARTASWTTSARPGASASVSIPRWSATALTGYVTCPDSSSGGQPTRNIRPQASTALSTFRTCPSLYPGTTW